ncbi:MAG: AAA family ATPase [Deltaproteobacteria bacterium]|nr:AAA family ATPase [Candidatus Zymogenaceae bacterium]
MTDIEERKVPVEKLRWKCDPKMFPFKTTADIEPLKEIIGQERALLALKTGLEIDSPGYNIFVSGMTGTGRTTTIKTALEKFLEPGPAPDDICYVNNFSNPDNPISLLLPAGNGKKFKKAMGDLIVDIKAAIVQRLSGQDYKNKLKNVMEEFRNRQKELINRIKLRSQEEGFSLVQLQVGQGPITRPVLVPNFQSQPTSLENLEEMVESGEFPAERFEELKSKSFELNSELENIQRESIKIERELVDRVKELEAEEIAPIVTSHVDAMKETFTSLGVSEYLDSARTDILENIDIFKEQETPQSQQLPFPLMGLGAERDPLWRYEVNLLVDNSRTKGRPVIPETTPSYTKLFGTFDRNVDRMGGVYTDFTKLKAGSVHRANGGYLIVNTFDLLTEAGSWRCLKRVLIHKKIEFQCVEPMFLFASTSLKPGPIDANIKVIMVGDPYIYHLLLAQDDDFPMIFKVKSDFDSVMEKNGDHIHQYASFVKKISDDESLAPFLPAAVSEVVEFGVREARSQKKMTTRLSEVADIVRESAYWAGLDGNDAVDAVHVRKALTERDNRVNMTHDKIRERISEGVLMIETEGSRVGQVNGLAVYSLGTHMFGAPSKITAVTSLGRAGIVDIEREAKLSGSIYNKGVLILSGYLRGKYARRIPLTLSASLCFEQSYYGVDGDSASSTELYAIISGVTGLPLRQDIAVTGSVNQKGEVQPIGGVNQKIEGFFAVCKDRGLTGTQGVMIPQTNVEDLMLTQEVVDAVSEGAFTIYSVSTIDEGIEILTGVPAGEEGDDGTFPEGSVNRMVVDRLMENHERLRELNKGKDNEKGTEKSGNGGGDE